MPVRWACSEELGGLGDWLAAAYQTPRRVHPCHPDMQGRWRAHGQPLFMQDSQPPRFALVPAAASCSATNPTNTWPCMEPCPAVCSPLLAPHVDTVLCNVHQGLAGHGRPGGYPCGMAGAAREAPMSTCR